MAKKRIAEPWRNAIVRYAVEPIDSLVPHPQNPKHHPPEQRDALIGSLNEFGIVAPALVNERSNRMLDGHKRLIEAQDRGQPTFPVLYVDVPVEKEGAFLASFDAIGWMASNDQSLIAALLKSAHVEDSMLSDFLDTLRQPEPKQLNDDDADLTPPTEPITKPGDLWLLGEHRLLCGDATKAEDVARLMGGALADMVFTDPPYGVDYDGGAKKRERLDGDRVGTSIYGDSLPILRNAAHDHAALYLWYADAQVAAAAAAAAGYEITAQIIWVKNNAQFVSAAKYHGKHEPCFYAHRKGRSAAWYGPNNEVTVWEVDRAPRNDMHPTQKPVELAARAIGNSSRGGDVVLDLFGGSGSTLIAAEQASRRAYLLEISPAYCDVIVRRWETVTGRKAVLDGALV